MCWRGLVLALVPWALGCGDGPANGGGPPAAPAAVHVHAGGPTAIETFRADLRTGALSFVTATAAGEEALLVDVDSQVSRAYVQTQLGGAVALLSFDVGRADGRLARTGEIVLPQPMVEGVTQILLHPAAPWLLVSATGGANGLEDWLMPVGADGRLGGEMHRTIATEFYAFAWDPSGQLFFGLDGEAIFQFRFDATTGALAPSDPPAAEGSNGHAMLSLATHPGGKWVYSLEENQIGLFDLDPQRGVLAARAFVRNPVTREPMYWTAMAVHPGGRFLYVLGYVTRNMVLLVDVYAIDPAAGTLTFVEREKGDGGPHQLLERGLQAPLVLADWLFVGGQVPPEAPAAGSGALAAYRIDAASGHLAPAGAGALPLRPASGSAVSFLFASAAAQR